ncbi:7ec75428-c355-4b70-b921-2387dcc9c954 [Thermothielavioides terrestris]|uniref:7ec75428-c355-4b70-b921-2387dcc9c954 n=1 Tax=Thermothielavioides terrestris TaxID=2587410 RepID=A0A446B6F6_9PEZI|nr:7ec75428-c355-4b70-b921-2387dcc9c954 [Thermothielavioides terrestris]
MSPSSDIVGPSPVTSNGTETTEIEDEAAENAEEENGNARQSLTMLRTNIPDHIRRPLSDEVVSVIHAPPSFQNWKSGDAASKSTVSNSASGASAEATDASSPPPSEPSTITSPGQVQPTVDTKVKPVSFGVDAPTPQAQKLEDVIANDTAKLRSSTGGSLELIPERHEGDGEDDFDDADPFANPARGQDSEVKALKAALEECWTLCNTLANLSSIHRERVFNSSGTPDAHERAWKSCWKLCKRLYQSRDDISESYGVRTNLDLCRDFCQALFDVRQRKDETADSILRVSFELNNHLYSAQDSRSLPEAFRERTLDFYITLCHRLMKQRSDLAEETDSLLRACWSLAEMLFSLRQNRRDGKAPDEELLGSAVQACWELCDIFREGWTQIRPDRGTPRPNQINFFAAGPPYGLQGMGSHQSDSARSNAGSRASLHSKRESLRSLGDIDRPRPHPVVPETPVTEFEDTPVSPDASPQMPNILVLGPSTDSRSDRGGRWSSNASNLSGYTQSSQHTSSTATTTTAVEDINVTRVKALIVKAAMNVGFNRDAAAANGTGAAASLQSFVKSLPTGSFGSLPSHATLLQGYKNLVLNDTSFRPTSSLPPRGKRFTAAEIAKSVGWMTLRSGQYGFLRDLFKLVFGVQPEEAETRKNISITI